jgi:hypothetical protein
MPRRQDNTAPTSGACFGCGGAILHRDSVFFGPGAKQKHSRCGKFTQEEMHEAEVQVSLEAKAWLKRVRATEAA